MMNKSDIILTIQILNNLLMRHLCGFILIRHFLDLNLFGDFFLVEYKRNRRCFPRLALRGSSMTHLAGLSLTAKLRHSFRAPVMAGSTFLLLFAFIVAAQTSLLATGQVIGHLIRDTAALFGIPLQRVTIDTFLE